MEALIVVCSDRCSRGEARDKSGPALESMVKEELEMNAEIKIIPDDQDLIKETLLDAVQRNVALVLTTGGTGFAPRDVTPEATRAVIEREAPGLVVSMLVESLKITPHAALSRPVAGTKDKTLIVNLPGSTKGATESLGAIITSLPHALDLINDRVCKLSQTHDTMKIPHSPQQEIKPKKHVCPHKNRAKTSVTDAPAMRDRKSPWPMVPVPDALRTLIEKCVPVNTERVPISQCLHRILAEEVTATVALPPFPASIKDGYAVNSADGAGIRRVKAAVVAGSGDSTLHVPRGQCVRVNTGAPVPPGCDAVIQVEDTTVAKTGPNNEELEVSLPAVSPGNDIRQVGSDIQLGEKLLTPGEQLTPARIGLCCTVGRSEVSVYSQVRVLVYSTGAELVDINGGKPSFGQVYDSNRYALMASLQETGLCQVTDGGILPDQPQSLLDSLSEAIEKYDLIITSGGVSTGEKDYIKSIIKNDLEGTIHFGRVNMKPGKPTTFATFANSKAIFFGLPGNPTSSLVTFTLFVKPALKLLTGQKPGTTIIQATTAEEIILDPRPEYHRCILDFSRPRAVPIARSTGSQCSANINSCSKANGLIIVPQATADREKIDKGAHVSVMLFQDI